MKNIYKIISILLVSVMLLCSCSAVVETQVQPTEEVTPTPTVEPTPMPTKLEDIGQIVYFRKRDKVGYTLDEFENSEYRDVENGIITINETIGPRVVEEDVPKKITWNFLGNELELEYKYSSVFSHTNDCFGDVYIDRYENVRLLREVYFLHGTNQLVYMYWAGMKNWPSNLETYEDYLGVVDLALGDFIDLDKYEVTCSTMYYDENDNYIIQTTDEFYYGKSGEVVYGYNFYLNLNINEIPTLGGIRYSFYPDNSTMVIQCKVAEYDEEEISKITQAEIDYACDLTDKFIDKYTPNLIYKKAPHFLGVDVLNDRTYLVFEVIPKDGDNDRFYVDYERLQWKMALDKKT